MQEKEWEEWGFVLGNYLGRRCDESCPWWKMMSRNGLDIRGSDYCLLLELFAQSAGAGSILFKESIQTLSRTPNEPCLCVVLSYFKAVELPRTKFF